MKIKPTDSIALLVPQKGHPSIDPDFAVCSGEPTLLPSGTTGLVMKNLNGRLLIQYRTASAPLFGWTDEECTTIDNQTAP